jgi:hypothetical protein
MAQLLDARPYSIIVLSSLATARPRINAINLATYPSYRPAHGRLGQRKTQTFGRNQTDSPAGVGCPHKKHTSKWPHGNTRANPVMAAAVLSKFIEMIDYENLNQADNRVQPT